MGGGEQEKEKLALVAGSGGSKERDDGKSKIVGGKDQKLKKYKKIERKELGGNMCADTVKVGLKRGVDDMEIDGEAVTKKRKESDIVLEGETSNIVVNEAGLSVQSRGAQ